MKKRVLSAIAAGVLAAAMCVGFAACGEEKAPDPETMKSEKIESAEAWAAAFDFDGVTDYKLILTDETTAVVGGESATVIEAETFIVTAEAIHGIYEFKYIGKEGLLEGAPEDMPLKQEDYYKRGEPCIHYYRDEENAWVWKESYEPEELDIIETLAGLANAYEKYEYSEEKEAYVPKGGEMTEEFFVIIKFKDGKYSVGYQTETETEGDKSVTFSTYFIIEYGKQSVKLPHAKPADPDE